MTIRNLRPMLWTEDLDGTIEFNVNVLGFTCRERNEDWGWASLFIDEFWIMLARPNELTEYDKIGSAGSFCYNTDDVDGLWGQLKDKAKVCYDIENFPYGMREFVIYDNNGYLLQFGQEMKGQPV